jgi:hypothetical protein
MRVEPSALKPRGDPHHTRIALTPSNGATDWNHSPKYAGNTPNRNCSQLPPEFDPPSCASAVSTAG